MNKLMMIALTLVLWTGMIGAVSAVSLNPATAQSAILNK